MPQYLRPFPPFDCWINISGADMFDYCYVFSGLWTTDVRCSEVFFACTWCVHLCNIGAPWQRIYQPRRAIGHSMRCGANIGSIGCSFGNGRLSVAARGQTDARSDAPVLRSKSMPPGDGDSRSRRRISSMVLRGAREASICHYWPLGCRASASRSARR